MSNDGNRLEARVAFLGPRGTFSDIAARSAFGADTFLEAATLDAVFDLVESNQAHHGIVPVENSTEGGVAGTLDRLLETDLLIEREVLVEVQHCLAAQGAGSLQSITRVYSHPQALGQCRRWLRANLPAAELVATPSTSAAAVLAQRESQSAAIVSHYAAELNGLVVLSRSIQDRPFNLTRFAVMGHSQCPATGRDKTSIVFSARHEKGALRKVLEVFEHHDLNLTRIESRPAAVGPWHYVFFADFLAHRDDQEGRACLAELSSVCETLKVLGSYPIAMQPLNIPLPSK